MIGKIPTPGAASAFAARQGSVSTSSAQTAPARSDSHGKVNPSQVVARVIAQTDQDLFVEIGSKRAQLKLPEALPKAQQITLAATTPNTANAEGGKAHIAGDVLKQASLRILATDKILLERPMTVSVKPLADAASNWQPQSVQVQAKVVTPHQGGQAHINIQISPGPQTVNPGQIAAQNSAPAAGQSQNMQASAKGTVMSGAGAASPMSAGLQTPPSYIETGKLLKSGTSPGQQLDSQVAGTTRPAAIATYPAPLRPAPIPSPAPAITMTVTARNDNAYVQLKSGGIEFHPTEPLPGLLTGNIVNVSLVDAPFSADTAGSEDLDRVISQFLNLASSDKPASPLPGQIPKMPDILMSMIRTIQQTTALDDENGPQGTQRPTEMIADASRNTTRQGAAIAHTILSEHSMLSTRNLDVHNHAFAKQAGDLIMQIEEENEDESGGHRRQQNKITLNIEFSNLGKTSISLGIHGNVVKGTLTTEGILDHATQTKIADLFGAGAELAAKSGHLVMHFARPPQQTI